MEKRYCVNHPDRPASGECVITKRPICPECSTKYEGVNYSKEGLEQLKRQRAAVASGGLRRKAVLAMAVGQAPVSLFLLYYFYLINFRWLTGLLK
ncbi:MAG: hypothetical protein OEV92_07620 [Nitrospinota bacterium]|nr:hypothetical protein [Nitrospinota bacterium]